MEHKNNRKRWKQYEDDYLINNLSKKKLNEIGEYLKRSERAIQGRLQKLNINVATHNDKLTVSDLSRTIQKPCNTVRDWIKFYGLQSQKEGAYRKVSIPDFWKWAKENPERLIFTDIEKNILVPEPDWVDDYRKNQPIKTRQLWSEEELDELKYLLTNSQLNRKDIAKRLNRSPSAIRHKVSQLDLNKDIKSFRNDKYTSRELDTILRMYYSGHSYKEIAERFNRTEAGVSTKIQRTVRQLMQDEKKRKEEQHD